MCAFKQKKTLKVSLTIFWAIYIGSVHPASNGNHIQYRCISDVSSILDDGDLLKNTD